jgi:uncharacterized protein YozE (UPF0346 family)
MRVGRFYQWLISREHESDIMGNLALEVRNDLEFPKWVASKGAAKEYLESCSPVGKSLEALDDAWKEFEQTQWGI